MQIVLFFLNFRNDVFLACNLGLIVVSSASNHLAFGRRLHRDLMQMRSQNEACCGLSPCLSGFHENQDTKKGEP